MYLSEHPYTFVYDGNEAVDFNCGCFMNHSAVCEQVRQKMVDWCNRFTKEQFARIGKRNQMLGVETDIKVLASRESIDRDRKV